MNLKRDVNVKSFCRDHQEAMTFFMVHVGFAKSVAGLLQTLL